MEFDLLHQQADGVLPFLELQFFPNLVEALERLTDLLLRHVLVQPIADLQRQVRNPRLERLLVLFQISQTGFDRADARQLRIGKSIYERHRLRLRRGQLLRQISSFHLELIDALARRLVRGLKHSFKMRWCMSQLTKEANEGVVDQSSSKIGARAGLGISP